MKPNILLIIVDCLRYDRATPQYMPWLSEFARNNLSFTNFWSTSHSTDPAITSLLTGLWPDELGLYAMMYEVPDYSIPDDITPLAHIAHMNGYHTGAVTNLGRWYMRGCDAFVDTKPIEGERISFAEAARVVKTMQLPWFMMVHNIDCHKNYRDGSYNAACRAVDRDMGNLVRHVVETMPNTYVIITADHGEGLCDHGIDQHGYGLWPALTHVPLAIHDPIRRNAIVIDKICQHVDLYDYMLHIILNGSAHPYLMHRPYAYIVGRVPRVWHRAITDGKTMLFKEQFVDGPTDFHLIDTGTDKELPLDMAMWKEAREFAAQFGIDADSGLGHSDDAVLIERLKDLGYYD